MLKSKFGGFLAAYRKTEERCVCVCVWVWVRVSDVHVFLQ